MKCSHNCPLHKGLRKQVFYCSNLKQTSCEVIFFGQRNHFQGQKSKIFMQRSLAFFQDPDYPANKSLFAGLIRQITFHLFIFSVMITSFCTMTEFFVTTKKGKLTIIYPNNETPIYSFNIFLWKSQFLLISFQNICPFSIFPTITQEIFCHYPPLFTFYLCLSYLWLWYYNLLAETS